MKLIFNTKTLASAVEKAAALVGRASVMLSTDGTGNISLQACGSDFGVRVSCDCEIKESGDPIALPAKKFADIVKSLTEDETTITTSESHIGSNASRAMIVSGAFKAHLNVFDYTLIPDFPTTDTTPVTVDREALFTALRKVLPFVSTEQTRYFLNGVYFDLDGDDSRLVATDGKSLAIAKVAMDTKHTMIVPAVAINRMVSLFPDGDLTIAADDSRLIVRGDNAVMYTALIEGEYPDYNMVLTPVKENAITVECNTGDLMDALRRVSLVATKVPMVKVTCSVERGIELETKEATLGEATERIPGAECSEGVEFAVNGDYMLRALKSADGERMAWLLKDKLLPVLVCAIGDTSFEAVIMPMKL